MAINHKAFSNTITKLCVHNREQSNVKPTWLLNRYLRHSEGKTSYERNWKQPYNQPTISSGGKVYVDEQVAPNMKIYQKNQQQNAKLSGLDETPQVDNMSLLHQSLANYGPEQS
eukprot:6479627-Amphidinium_carterae.1